MGPVAGMGGPGGPDSPDSAESGAAGAEHTPSAAAGTDVPSHSPLSAPTGPCAEQRRATDELCALADRMSGQAAFAVEALRDAQREYDNNIAAADQAAAVADPRGQRAAKEAAQHAFRGDRADATSQEGVEAAARTWLQEINRINNAAREATQRVTRERDAANAMITTLERLTLEADAARVQAEAAKEACLHAREGLAECEEAVDEQRRIARMPLAPSLAPGEAPPQQPGSDRVPSTAREPVASRARAFGPGASDDSEPDEADALAAAAARGDGQPAILQLLTGDRGALERLSAEVAGNDPAERRRWQVQIGEFIDAVVARAIEACAFDFPEDHPFWGPFTVEQDRDIALALSSLGFRFDGLGGFVDDRVPSQRDLSLAVGYAGLDPMRIRRWPTEAEMGDLYRDVRVAADEYLAGAAGGLSLGELVTLLGRRADGLTELWNAWGRVRPRLLEPI
jgi:hypothetical protein